ncbi:enoyl-CoA hydratase/isomerase family protein [Parafrankia sp. FMc6]|uniref:enoyl-CoA hydratase/isomerase family protein n=1 Tax=Parafrankia soli TaxID=2599596 RepID=UPI0034D40356
MSLNRPKVHNAINKRMQEELREVRHDIRYDNDVRCVVLTAEGPSFCTGIDRAEAISPRTRTPRPWPLATSRATQPPGCTTTRAVTWVQRRGTVGSRS